jgi:thiamine biosynthesis lipoprotein
MSAAAYRFRAMGSEVMVMVTGGPAGLGALAARHVDHLERCWSRFRPDSDVTRLNLAGGRPLRVDPATIELLQAMVRGVRATSGAFDPTQLAPIVALGYERSLGADRARCLVPAEAQLRGDLGRAEIDGDACCVRLPLGTVLDPGGIGKGLAADLTAELLVARGARGALVSVGGDLRVAGEAPDGHDWRIGIDDDGVEAEQVMLVAGGVATSAPAGRCWRGPDGRLVHHLLDPANGRPTHRAVQATVIAGTAAWAEVWTKALMVRGSAEVLPMLDALHLPARVVEEGGSLTTGRWWPTAGLEAA